MLFSAHINHIRKNAGVNHVGLGAGYDGITNPPTELPDVSGLLHISLINI